MREAEEGHPGLTGENGETMRMTKAQRECFMEYKALKRERDEWQARACRAEAALEADPDKTQLREALRRRDVAMATCDDLGKRLRACPNCWWTLLTDVTRELQALKLKANTPPD